MRPIIRFILCFLLVLCAIGTQAQVPSSEQKDTAGDQYKYWPGRLKDGTPLTWKRLQELLDAHKEYTSIWSLRIIEEEKKAGKIKSPREDILAFQAELIASDWDADKGRLVLEGAYLPSFNNELEGVDLSEANLKETSLIDVNLKGAKLSLINLEGAKLDGVNLEEAFLLKANLAKAYLYKTNLKGAYLDEANLKRAVILNVNMEGADLRNVNLEEARYEPKVGHLPDIQSLISAKHLETMRFQKSPHAMVELRQTFKNVGFRQKEREITHAIKRSQRENAWSKGEFAESAFTYLFFELPVAYGLYPGRALKILASLIPVFAILYGLIIWKPSGKHGIWRVWPKDRIEAVEDAAMLAEDAKIELLNQNGPRIAMYALYFSLLSAFHIGWRELNIGTWIARLQPRIYTFQATGWVRSVSGIQSLISVFLLAMWALSYFGRPFE